MEDEVIILLSTYNGARFLKEQLDSLMLQSYTHFNIIARDDGSNDDTIKILSSYNIKIIPSNSNLGAKLSFGKLLQYALENTHAKYFMFCDQDDIWEKDKIEKSLYAMKELENTYGNIPLLVHSDLSVVDQDLHLINKSFCNYENIDPTRNHFSMLMMQNTVTGCTMIINKQLAHKSIPVPSEAIMHDWWIALIASYFGKIHFINTPTIQYRQHDKNEIGAKKKNLKYYIKKFFTTNDLLSSNFIQANKFLNRFDSKIDIKTKKTLEEFLTISKKNFFQKRFTLTKYKLYKHGFIKNLGLFFKL